MKTEDIKRIMIVYNDNDFIRIWDWIGKVLLNTITTKNVCGEKMLEDSETIENFVFSLLPVAIEFTQYKVGKYEDYCLYNDITKKELDWLCDEFKNVKFNYNFEETDDNFGCETLIIDFEKNKSYIR